LLRALMACCVWSIRGVLVPWATAGDMPSPANKADANKDAVKSFDFIWFSYWVDELDDNPLRCLQQMESIPDSANSCWLCA
jgi:hypothetical protein